MKTENDLAPILLTKRIYPRRKRIVLTDADSAVERSQPELICNGICVKVAKLLLETEILLAWISFMIMF